MGLHLFGDPHSPKLRQDAPVVKLVDTRDLKSLGLWLCRFDSGPGHHLYLSLYLLQYSLFSLSFFKLRHQAIWFFALSLLLPCRGFIDDESVDTASTNYLNCCAHYGIIVPITKTVRVLCLTI